MAVGGNATQGLALQVEQQAIEIITDVLLRHGESGAFDQLFQRRFRHSDAFDDRELVVLREIPGRQGSQGVAALAGLDGSFIAAVAERDLAAVRQGAHDVEQFAGGNGDFAVLAVIDRIAGGELDLQIRAFQRQLAVFDLDQQVAQHRQRLPALDDVDDLLQGFQKRFAGEAKTHRRISNN